MIRRIFLDLDDVCNTLAPFVLHSVGCDIGPRDYARYPREHGVNIADAANAMLSDSRYTPATFWASMPRSIWVKVPESDFFPWLLEECAKAVGRENVCIATSPTKCPESLAGELEWIHDHFPEWMHRQFAITPRKHLFARTGFPFNVNKHVAVSKTARFFEQGEPCFALTDACIPCTRA